MQAAMILFIHQSTLDSALFFFIGSQVRAACQIPCVQQLELALPSEPGIELYLFGWAPSNLDASSLLQRLMCLFCIQTTLSTSPVRSLLHLSVCSKFSTHTNRLLSHLKTSYNLFHLAAIVLVGFQALILSS